MQCPKCLSDMEVVTFKTIEVERCTSCKGLWFDMLKQEDLKKLSGSEVIDTGDPEIGKVYNKIDKINSMSRDELKDMYKFILNHQKLSAKGGGGLGLVDIARKTGNKLEYSFKPIAKGLSTFHLKIIF